MKRTKRFDARDVVLLPVGRIDSFSVETYRPIKGPYQVQPRCEIRLRRTEAALEKIKSIQVKKSGATVRFMVGRKHYKMRVRSIAIISHEIDALTLSAEGGPILREKRVCARRKR